MHLKYSKGSRQVVQRYSALHGVDANSLSRSVRVDAQRGHAMLGSLNRWRGLATVCAGGAIPYSRSLLRPSGDSQSLVHAGDSTVSMRTFACPAAVSFSRIEPWMTSVAGQPVYVGDTPTVTESSSACT